MKSHTLSRLLLSLVIIMSLGSFTLEASATSIVGSWYGTNLGQAQSTVALTFLNDGTYLMAEDGSSVLDPSGQDGMERGTYSWNAATGSFSSTTLVDTSGQWGLSHSGPGLNIQVVGNTATVNGSTTFTRVADISNPIVGSWYGTNLGQAQSTVALTFLNDGTYLMAEDGSSVLDPSGQDGMERGTYSWNAATGSFSSTTLVDTSGQWGLSHSGPGLNIQVVGNTATVNGSTTFTRVAAVPVPAAAWLLGSGLIGLAGITRKRKPT